MLFEGPFQEVSKGDCEYLISQDLRKGLSSQDETNYFVFRFDCHLADRIVE